MKELKRFARSAGEQIMIVGGEIGHANTDAVATLHICPLPVANSQYVAGNLRRSILASKSFPRESKPLRANSKVFRDGTSKFCRRMPRSGNMGLA